eukprot:4338-Heterococcus_DN1.PRE.1
MMVNGNRGMFSNAKNHAAALGQQNDASQSPADSYGVCAESYAALVWSAMPLCHRQRQLEAVQACRSAPGCCAMCSCLRSLQGLTLQSEAVLASLLAHSQHQVLQQLSQQASAEALDARKYTQTYISLSTHTTCGAMPSHYSSIQTTILCSVVPALTSDCSYIRTDVTSAAVTSAAVTSTAVASTAVTRTAVLGLAATGAAAQEKCSKEGDCV